MLFLVLAQTSAAVGGTRSRLAKKKLLAATIGEADSDEIGIVVSFLSGSLTQRRTGVGWASLGEIPAAAAEQSLSVQEVNAAFDIIAALSGGGSAAERARLVQELFARATDPEQHFLRGLVFSELRQGALDALVQEGLATAFDVRAAVVHRAAMLLGSTSAAATLLATGGMAALQQVLVAVGRPIRPMLAAAAPGPEQAVIKSGLPAIVDAKLDGIRIQAHRAADGTVRLFTRSLDDITDRLPEIVLSIRRLAVQSIILDGEVVGLGPDGRPLPFQLIASRTASRSETSEPAVALSLFAFDILQCDGRDLLEVSLRERSALLAAVVPSQMRVPRIEADSVAQIEAFFAHSVEQGFEGVVVKKMSAPYAAGRRDSGWIKVKPRHTFDLAVIAAEWGYGRRQGWLSNLHLAARDSAGELVMLGKTFKGLTDQMLAWQTEQFQARESRRTKTTVHLDPPLVAEIAIDGVQRSVRYPGGVALRFARVIRYREDKSVAEVDSLDSIIALSPLFDEEPVGPPR